MADHEDREDVRRVLAGDDAGFDGIVRRWQGPLINLAYRYVRDRGRAEDLAQEAFVLAYRRLSQYRGDAAFSTWLFALALNVCRSEVRRHAVTFVPLDALRDLPARRPAQLELLAAERDEIVRRAVLSLPVAYRDALILFYFMECDLAGTARVLGRAEGTVKALLHRGRGLLERKLEGVLGRAGAGGASAGGASSAPTGVGAKG